MLPQIDYGGRASVFRLSNEGSPHESGGMVMLSLGKILGLAVILFVVWQVFRFLETQKKIRESQSSGHDQSGASDGAAGSSVDMIECPRCGKWYQAANEAEHSCE